MWFIDSIFVTFLVLVCPLREIRADLPGNGTVAATESSATHSYQCVQHFSVSSATHSYKCVQHFSVSNATHSYQCVQHFSVSSATHSYQCVQHFSVSSADPFLSVRAAF